MMRPLRRHPFLVPQAIDWSAAVLALWLCVSFFGPLCRFIPAQPRVSAGQETLTTVKQVHELSAAAAATHRPFRLTGVVTVLSTWPNAFFFEDRTGGISVENDHPTPAYTSALVEITGYSSPGLFAPVAHATNVRVLGRGSMPPARLFSYPQLTGGGEDSSWIAVRGVVRSAVPDISWGHKVQTLIVEVDGSLISTQLQGPVEDTSARLVDAVVRMRGICTTSFNDKRQFTGVKLNIPSMDYIDVEQPPPADPYALPITPVRSLLQFKPGVRFNHRVQVNGTVTYQDTNTGIYLQDGNDGVLIETGPHSPVSIGTRMTAVGFPASGFYSPILRQAIFRPLHAEAPPAPAAIGAKDFLHRDKFITAPYDAQLVTVKGQLVETTSNLNDDSLLLRDGGTHFLAILRRPSGSSPLPPIDPGSIVRVTGVFSVQVDDSGEPTSFRVLMRGGPDVMVVKNASWWSPQHALGLVSVLMLATLAIALWGATLRRTVRQQTQMLRESEERFRKQAQHDTLTGLVSRSFLHEQLHEAIRKVRFSGEKLGVLMVDLDFFKQVNDTLGHHAGDEVLCVVADRLRAAVRKTDVVARMGGDEFVVLLNGLQDTAEAREIGAKVVSFISRPARIAGREMPISASVGVCLYPDGGNDGDSLLQNVDLAMYKAKAEGRNGCAIYAREEVVRQRGSGTPALASARF